MIKKYHFASRAGAGWIWLHASKIIWQSGKVSTIYFNILGSKVLVHWVEPITWFGCGVMPFNHQVPYNGTQKISRQLYLGTRTKNFYTDSSHEHLWHPKTMATQAFYVYCLTILYAARGKIMFCYLELKSKVRRWCKKRLESRWRLKNIEQMITFKSLMESLNS